MGKTILICCNVYPPLFIGGAELIAHAQAKKLQNLGHSVTIFTGDIQTNYERHSLRTEDYDGLRVFRACLTSEDYQVDKINFYHQIVEEHFTTLLNELSPDVVHFHNIIGLSIGIIHIAKQRGVKTVMTLHDHWGFCLKNTLVKLNGEICQDYNRCSECLPFVSDHGIHQIPIQMRKDFFSILFQDIDSFISPSQYLADAYIRAGLPESKFNVIWNGIDVNYFSQIEKKRSDRVRFTFIGYFGRHKGIHILLDALPLLVKEKNKFFINLVGDGEVLGECKDKVRKMGLQNVVKFWGKIKNISDAYRDTDVLILPSVWPENQPVTITEAMSSRTPVIASNLGGTPELIDDEKTGYLFKAGDPGDLAKKMSNFIRDPEKIQIFGNEGYNKIASNTVESQVSKILSIYDSIIPEHQNTNHNEVIIACIGNRVSPQCIQAMDAMRKNMPNHFLRFVMGDWFQTDQYKKVKLLWIVDPKAKFDNVIVALKAGVPLLVPENHLLLKEVCIREKCGLYYRDSIEAQYCIDYLIQMERERLILGNNGRRFISG